MMKEPYNASQDSERKRALNLLLSHTKQQERKDVEVWVVQLHILLMLTDDAWD